MTRSFDGRPLDEALVIGLFEASLHAPTAGHARGVEWLVLVGPEEVARYFDAATDASWRADAPRAAGLQRASAIGLCLARPDRYLERYGRTDKADSGLGASEAAWPIPYWFGDAGSATMAALLLAEDQGLGAAFLGAFRHQSELADALGLTATEVPYGAVLLGHPDGAERRSRSLEVPGPTRSARVRRLSPLTGDAQAPRR